MSIFRILPKGEGFQAVETNGLAKTLTVATFATKAEAQQWVFEQSGEYARIDVTEMRDRTAQTRSGPASGAAQPKNCCWSAARQSR